MISAVASRTRDGCLSAFDGAAARWDGFRAPLAARWVRSFSVTAPNSQLKASPFEAADPGWSAVMSCHRLMLSAQAPLTDDRNQHHPFRAAAPTTYHASPHVNNPIPASQALLLA